MDDTPLSIDVKPSSIDVQAGEGVSAADLQAFAAVVVLMTGNITHSQMPVQMRLLLSPDEARGHAMGLIIGAFLAEQHTEGEPR